MNMVVIYSMISGHFSLLILAIKQKNHRILKVYLLRLKRLLIPITAKAVEGIIKENKHMKHGLGDSQRKRLLI